MIISWRCISIKLTTFVGLQFVLAMVVDTSLAPFIGPPSDYIVETGNGILVPAQSSIARTSGQLDHCFRYGMDR